MRWPWKKNSHAARHAEPVVIVLGEDGEPESSSLAGTGTSDPAKAINAINEAIEQLDIVEKAAIRSAYKELRKAWGCKKLVSGSQWLVVEVVSVNLLDLSDRRPVRAVETRIDDSKTFATVLVGDYSGGLKAFRLWRSESDYFLCGPRAMILDDTPLY